MEHRPSSETRRVLIISGYDCSGKSTFAKNVASPFDPIIEAGAIVRDVLGLSRGPELTRMYGENIEMLNRRIVSETVSIHHNLKESKSSALIVVGVRSISLLVELNRVFPAAIAIFMDASRNVRYQRHLASRRFTIIPTFRAFVANDVEQRKWGVEEVKKAASYIVKAQKSE